MITYVDTSGLVKLVIEEPGSDTAGSAWSSADVRVASVLAYPEARAALAAARRAGRLPTARASKAVSLLERRCEELTLVEVTRQIAWRAGDLAKNDRLRGADAVHLATALAASAGGELFVLTWDAALAAAAMRHGAAVVTGVA